jgi:hypothetical protein
MDAQAQDGLRLDCWLALIISSLRQPATSSSRTLRRRTSPTPFPAPWVLNRGQHYVFRNSGRLHDAAVVHEELSTACPADVERRSPASRGRPCSTAPRARAPWHARLALFIAGSVKPFKTRLMNSILWKILYYQLARRFAETVSEQPYARQTSPSRRGSSSTLRCGRGGRDGQRRESVGVGAGTATQQLGATAAIWRGAEKIVAKSWHLSVMNVFLPCFQL